MRVGPTGTDIEIEMLAIDSPTADTGHREWVHEDDIENERTGPLTIVDPSVIEMDENTTTTEN